MLSAKELISLRSWEEVVSLVGGDPFQLTRARVADLATGLASEVQSDNDSPEVTVTIEVCWAGGRVKMTARLDGDEINIDEEMPTRWVSEDTGEVFYDQPEVTWLEDGIRKGMLYRTLVVRELL